MKHPSSLPDAHCVAIRLGQLGDVLLTTGVLEHWRRSLDLRFTVITRQSFAGLFHNHPAVDRVIPAGDQELANWPRFCRNLARRRRGQTLLDLHGNLRARALSFFWKGPVRRYPKLWLRRRLLERFGWRFLAPRLEAFSVPQRYALALDHHQPAPDRVAPLMVLDPEELAAADDLLAQAPGDGPFAALHPYAAHPNKAWPRRHWLDLARLIQDHGLRPVVVGKSDTPLAATGALDLTSRTDLRQSAAVLARCRFLVTGDSGPMHLARAVSTPVVALFGPTVRAWGFFPDGPRDRVVERALDCRPCSLHGARPCPRELRCLADIAPSEVLDAAFSAISEPHTEDA